MNDMKLPANDMGLPMNDMRLPVNDMTLPISDMGLPVNDMTLPISDMILPGVKNGHFTIFFMLNKKILLISPRFRRYIDETINNGGVMDQAVTKLVETGKRLKTRNLIEQASYTLNLAREDFTELEVVGLTQELLDSSNVLKNEIVNLEGAQESAKDNIPLQTLQVHGKVEEGKQWLKKSKLKAKRAFRLEEVKQHDFFSGPPVGVSVPRLIAALSKHIELHRKYTTDLTVYKGGVDFADEGEELLQELQQIDTSQERSKTALPQASYDLYYKQGVLFYNLKDINDMAEEVFINDTLSARKYHLDILKR